ncbi:MAG: heme exporter protein CcmB [Ignavibacteriales bacterium]|nr:heme exporter protein CcmB [Ignavibacteriales bacterium]
MSALSSTYAVVVKDVQSELRTRYALNALVMFVVTTVSIILFALRGDQPSNTVLAGMFWVVVFFTSMSGLSRAFVSEEERGTSLTLQLIASPSVIYFGKLLFNVFLTLTLVFGVTIVYTVVFPGFTIQSLDIFLATVFLGSLGLASAATIIAAIIAKANTRGTLYPVLSFPILIVLLMTVMSATVKSLDGEPFSEAMGDVVVLISYCMVMTAGSFLLFDYVWKD